MKCDKVDTLLIDYLDNALAEELRTEVEKHLLSCEKCSQELDKTQALLHDIGKIEEQKPGRELRENFYTMLEEEKKNLNKEERELKQLYPKNEGMKVGLRYAAVFILLIGLGFLLGRISTRENLSNERFSELEQQVNNLQNNITVTQLSKPSASERIQAVQVINKKQSPDTKMINALIHTMNNDDNINVRLAAANALKTYSKYDFVKNALINSLDKQENPVMQITLINILIQLQDKRAVQPLKQIIEKEENPEIVKKQAKEGLKVFL